ncbi:RNA-binding domain-containing protein [Daldinia bambusicola]|nr:RNA-binding domain-containing protein [Daldinia bambusicola]
MHSLRRAAARAASSSIAVAAPRKQIASFAMQVCKATARPAVLMPVARHFSMTSRMAQYESENAAFDQTFESAEQTQSGQDPEQAKKIYVRNLPYDATDDMIKEAFTKYGEVADIQVAREPSGASKGFCFISFTDEESATRAIEEGDNSFWQGRRMFVQPRTSIGGGPRTPKAPRDPSSSLYIGNIPYETSDADLNTIFRDLENVVNVRVAVDRNTGWPRGFAHADFKSIEDAEKAFEKLQGFTLGQRTLRIDYADPPKAPEPRNGYTQGRNNNRGRGNQGRDNYNRDNNRGNYNRDNRDNYNRNNYGSNEYNH